MRRFVLGYDTHRALLDHYIGYIAMYCLSVNVLLFIDNLYRITVVHFDSTCMLSYVKSFSFSWYSST